VNIIKLLPDRALQVSAAAVLKLHLQYEKYTLALDVPCAELSQKKKKKKRKPKASQNEFLNQRSFLFIFLSQL